MSDPIRHSDRRITIARWIFWIAGGYGVVIMIPMLVAPDLFLRGQPLTQPEFYYGFVLVVLAWQIVFLLTGADPQRYRPLMLIAALGEKFAFVIAVLILIATKKIAPHWAGPATLDALLGGAFLFAFSLTRPH